MNRQFRVQRYWTSGGRRQAHAKQVPVVFFVGGAGEFFGRSKRSKMAPCRGRILPVRLPKESFSSSLGGQVTAARFMRHLIVRLGVVAGLLGAALSPVAFAGPVRTEVYPGPRHQGPCPRAHASRPPPHGLKGRWMIARGFPSRDAPGLGSQ